MQSDTSWIYFTLEARVRPVRNGAYHKGEASRGRAEKFMAENRLDLNSFPTIIDVPREQTASLLAKVLGITSLGFLITAFGVATAPPWGTLPGLIAVFALVFGISFARKANP